MNKNNLLKTNYPDLFEILHPTKNAGLNIDNISCGSEANVWWRCSEGHCYQRKVFLQIKNRNCPTCNSLQYEFPDIARQWHPTKNGDLTPNNVSSKSGKKVWWLCENGHEWQIFIYNRTRRGDRCPFCSGKRASKEYSLFTQNENLSKEWHPTKNGNLTPFEVTPGSSKKVWWICKRGHEWESAVSNRTYGNGCPYCSRQKVSYEGSLESTFPTISLEWHPIKNGKLTPKDFVFGSNKKVWWICKKGHEWQDVIYNRTRKNYNCPFCSGKRPSKEYSLFTKNEDLSKEWHPSKNGDLTPFGVTPGSRKKVWWICQKGHEWESTVANRTFGNGCPYCSGNKVCVDNCLNTKFPNLYKEWHPTKNGDKTPENVLWGSPKNFWWICEKGHEWKTSINKRTNRGDKCPYCSGKRVCIDNCIETLYPNLAKEWHPIKNGSLTPADFTTGSSKNVWWICEKGHEWKATIHNRTKKGSNCPTCSSHLKTSFPEQSILFYLKMIFPDIKNRHIFTFENKKLEVDLYIDTLNLAIEYDGGFFHSKKGKKERDEKKNLILFKNNIYLIRIREEECPSINMYGQHLILCKPDSSFNFINKYMKELLSFIETSFQITQDELEKIRKTTIDIQKDRQTILDKYLNF